MSEEENNNNPGIMQDFSKQADAPKPAGDAAKDNDFGMMYNFANAAYDRSPEAAKKFFDWTGLTNLVKRQTGGVDSNNETSNNPLFSGESITKYGVPGSLAFLFFSMKLGWDFKFSAIGAAVVSFVAGKLLGLTGLFNDKAGDKTPVEPAAKINAPSMPGGVPRTRVDTGGLDYAAPEPAGP